MFNNEHYIFGDQSFEVPAHLNFGKYMLDRLKLRKHEVAFERYENLEQLTYKNLTQYAVNLADILHKLGVGVGKTVALGSEKRNDFMPTMLAIMFTGATGTPFSLKCGRAILKHNLGVSKPEYFICSKQFWIKYHDIIQSIESIQKVMTIDDDVTEAVIPLKSLIVNDVDIDRFEPAQVKGQTDVAYILYSSGTTGMPKAVQLTHLNCLLTVHSFPDDFTDDSLKTVYTYGTWSHNYDTFMTFKFLSLGKKLVYAVGDNSIHLLLKSLQDQKVNIGMFSPSIVAHLHKFEELDKYNLESLKIIYSRSAPLHSKIIESLKARLPTLENVLQGYGMSECGEPASEVWAIKGRKPGSVGMVSPGLTLKIVDPETEKVLGANERGEIRLRGPVLMKGYKAVDPSSYLDEEGFFKTGDLGYYDEDNYVYIVDRLKEIFKHAGVNVAPVELETILQLHPGVKEAGVVGKPVPHHGEVPTAFVVRQHNSHVTEKELIEYVALEVSPYLQLQGGITFIEKLPRNATGKILRRSLRELLKTPE